MVRQISLVGIRSRKRRCALLSLSCLWCKGNQREECFTTTGFNKWQVALTKGKGLHKHQNTSAHITNATKWEEFKSRQSSNKEISTLINDTVLQKHR